MGIPGLDFETWDTKQTRAPLSNDPYLPQDKMEEVPFH